MSQPPRIQSPNILFHVINRGNARQAVFRDQADFQTYLELLRKYKNKFDVHLYHFVLMSNHVHLLLEATKSDTLSKFMQGITISYTKRFNLKYHSVGHVWQARFRSIPIETDDHYLRCARYIELNPVRANIIHHPLDYPWSTYRQSSQNDFALPWIDAHPLLAEFNRKNPTSYKDFVENDMLKTQKHESESFSRLSAYGSRGFVKRFEI